MSNIFLVCIGVGIGLGAFAYGFGGVYLLICGISFAALAWGAAVAIVNRDRDTPRVPPPSRVPSRTT